MEKHNKQLDYLEGLINAIKPCDLDKSGNPYETIAAEIRNIKRGTSLTAREAAEHFLRGLGLIGFEFRTAGIVDILVGWGYTPKQAEKNTENWWRISAGNLVEVLNKHNVNL